ncbi:MAG: PHP-associated domain-containing protein [Actinomycetota bacterium]|nr:PHP domain-containing protein [Actinomycetota bacterium]
MLRIDLQVHTTAGSPDSVIAPAELSTRCRLTGIHGVATTEHLAPVQVASDLPVSKVDDCLVIPAREVTYLGAHLLVLSSDLELLTQIPRRVEDEWWFRQGPSAVIWAHPGAATGSSAYPARMPNPEGMADVVHCVELLNGRHLHFAETIDVGRRLALSLGCAMTGGSDAHAPADIGRCFTIIEAEPTVDSVIAALRSQRCEPALGAAWAALHDYHYRGDLEEYLR